MSPTYDGVDYEVVFSGSDELIGERTSKITDENWKPPGRQYTKKSDYWGTGRFDKVWTFRECQDGDHDRCEGKTDDGARCKCRCHGPVKTKTESVKHVTTHKPNVTQIVVSEPVHGQEERIDAVGGSEPAGDVEDGAGTAGDPKQRVLGVQEPCGGEAE